MTRTAAMAAGVPTARQVRARLRQGRRRHHTKELGDFLTDLYILAFFLLMYGFAVVNAARRYLRSPSGGHGDPAERYWIGAAAVLAGAALAWQGLRMLGPLLATPAAQNWFGSTPVDRRGWLLPRFGVLLLAAATGTAVLSLAAAGVGQWSNPGWAALAGAGYGTAAAAAGVVAQGAPGRRWPRLLGVVVTGVAVVAAVVVIIGHFVGARLARPEVPLAAGLAVVGVPLAAGTAALAARALPRLDRAALTGGAQIATAAVTAAIWLDLSLLAGVIEGRRWRRVGRVGSRRFLPGGRVWVLLQAELRRQVRHPSALAVWAALALAQYAVAVAVPSVAGVTHIVGAYLAATRLTGGLRTICRSPGLRRALGGDDTTVRLVHLVIPAAGTALWWLVTAPAGGPHPGPVEILLLAGVVAAAYRAATRPPMAYGGAAIETPFGLIPVDLLRQVTRGPDVLAVVIVVQTLLS